MYLKRKLFPCPISLKASHHYILKRFLLLSFEKLTLSLILKKPFQWFLFRELNVYLCQTISKYESVYYLKYYNILCIIINKKY